MRGRRDARRKELEGSKEEGCKEEGGMQGGRSLRGPEQGGGMQGGRRGGRRIRVQGGSGGGSGGGGGGGGGGGPNPEGVLSDGQLDCRAGSIYRPSSLIQDERSGLGVSLEPCSRWEGGEGGDFVTSTIFMLQERQSNVNLRLHNHTTHANVYKLPLYSLVSGFCKTRELHCVHVEQTLLLQYHICFGNRASSAHSTHQTRPTCCEPGLL